MRPAAAVSNAGGLGILTASTPDDQRRRIDRCRSMADWSFWANLPILPRPSAPNARPTIAA